MLFLPYLGLKNTRIHPKSFNYIKHDKLDPKSLKTKLKPNRILQNRLNSFGLGRGRAGQAVSAWMGCGQGAGHAQARARRVGCARKRKAEGAQNTSADGG